MKIITYPNHSSYCANTDWIAIDDETYDLDQPTGYGATAEEAIESLLAQIEAK